MSKGAFTIIDSYVGKQEAILTASDKLSERLRNLHEKNLDSKKWENASEAMPSFVDISESHMFYVKRTFKPFVAFAYEYFKSSLQIGGGGSLPEEGSSSELRFNMRANNGDFIHDQVLKLVFKPLGNPNATSTDTRYRYCDYPGIRVLKEIKLSVDKDVIDTYTPLDVMFHMNNRLDSKHKEGFEELVGQQRTHIGTYYISNMNVEQVMMFRDGAQTFRPYQPALEIWIPLIFDHNIDVGRSLHNRIIGSQQIYIELVFESMGNIVQAVDSANNPLTDQPAKLEIQELSLYTKNIYINPEINDLFTEKNNISLIRIHKQHVSKLTSPNQEILLSSLKYPIEILHFGFRPDINANVKLNPKYAFADWHKLAFMSRTCVPIPAMIPSLDPLFPNNYQLVVRTAKYIKCNPAVNTIGFTIHGNVLYQLTAEKFFSSYQNNTIPGIYPNDQCGYYTISFSHYPTIFAPSGHVNNSTARELYINYESTRISSVDAATLYVSAQCINFLLYKDGSIKLKYIA